MSKYIKSPVNWVGNKYKYLDIINELVSDSKYDTVFDLFLGSGNILLNIQCEAKQFVGNDKNKLIPNIYKKLTNYTYNHEDIEAILNRFNRFSTKEDYYIFRDYWNEKYLSDSFDKDFIIETMLLLKMCSNSMVRFNSKEGYFNQGFRGLGTKKEFFRDATKDIVVNGLNKLKETLLEKEFIFTNENFIEFKDVNEKSLIILDPPYILRSDMYDNDFSKEIDDKILDLIKNTNNDFIYFNYLERDGEVYKELFDIIEKYEFRTIPINNKTLAGQGRKGNSTKKVQEVIITNIKKG